MRIEAVVAFGHTHSEPALWARELARLEATSPLSAARQAQAQEEQALQQPDRMGFGQWQQDMQAQKPVEQLHKKR